LVEAIGVLTGLAVTGVDLALNTFGGVLGGLILAESLKTENFDVTFMLKLPLIITDYWKAVCNYSNSQQPATGFVRDSFCFCFVWSLNFCLVVKNMVCSFIF
jgi:hypothetical protein